MSTAVAAQSILDSFSNLDINKEDVSIHVGTDRVVTEQSKRCIQLCVLIQDK